jgi:hypothetical protein
MLFRDRFLNEFSNVFFIDFKPKWLQNLSGGKYVRAPHFAPVPLLFAGCVFEDSLAHFGTMLVPFGSFPVPFSGQFSINVEAKPFNIEGLKPFYIEGKTLQH